MWLAWKWRKLVSLEKQLLPVVSYNGEFRHTAACSRIRDLQDTALVENTERAHVPTWMLNMFKQQLGALSNCRGKHWLAVTTEQATERSLYMRNEASSGLFQSGIHFPTPSATQRNSVLQNFQVHRADVVHISSKRSLRSSPTLQCMQSPTIKNRVWPSSHTNFIVSRSYILATKVEQSNNIAQHAPTGPASSNSSKAPISKILVANRGEIACRVIQTAKRLGIATVAVYSDADMDARHTKEADEAVYIGPALSDQSYLRGEFILQIASQTGAQAIHPGYGFLSENAAFAQLCKTRGIEFMGPPPSAIKSMGDKSASKALMISAGVPVVPGYHGANQEPTNLQAAANAIGYPVLIKATQGGGGKGMRIVEAPADFLDSLASAKREALASFGNDQVLVERYLSRPRHIEVQIFGDKLGNVVHLFERDCSVQRRHQKIIEEAPAPLVSEDFRRRIGEAAVNAAKAVGYVSAGTVEFIVDTNSGEFFFMEMNTRLQVEHPVTEMITGQDLVEWQIRVANGEPLPLTQSQLSICGHSFEARVYAENVPAGFLPATGTLQRCRPPPTSPTVRVETGVREGDRVSVFYDPMVAKLVVWGQDRAAALRKLRHCLGQYQIAGVPTNLAFLQALATHPAFAAGDVDTHFIPRHKDALLHNPPLSGEDPHGSTGLAKSVAAAGICMQDRWRSEKEARDHVSGIGGIWAGASGFRLGHIHTRTLAVAEGSEAGPSPPVAVSYLRDGSFRVQVSGGSPVTVAGRVEGGDETNLRIQASDIATSASLTSYMQGALQHVHLWLGGRHRHLSIPILQHAVEEAPESQGGERVYRRLGSPRPGAVVTPMAGRVVKVAAKAGQAVARGDAVVILEAMKMEHAVRAPHSGVLEEVNVAAGQQVQDGAVLFVLKGRLERGEQGPERSRGKLLGAGETQQLS